MPKLNRSLITSVIEDIKEFVTVANEMCTWIGKIEHSSWRYPTRSARKINAMAIVQHHKGSAGEMYILLLEIAYDRIHFVLRLVVEFIESYPFIEDLFEEVTKVKRPKSMSLANVIRTLWHRLKLIPETITRNMIKTKRLENSVFAGNISRGSQASSSLFYCESCSYAVKAIKELTTVICTALHRSNLSSVILEEREIIRTDIFGKTQWAVMTKLINAIDEDVKTLLETTFENRAKSEADIKEHEKSLQSFTVKFEKQKSERSFLEMKIQERDDQFHRVEEEMQSLKEAQEELVEENRVLTESLNKAEKKVSNLEILLAGTLQQIIEMGESKLALESTIKNLHNEITTSQQASDTKIKKLRESLERLREEKISEEKRYYNEIESLKRRDAEVMEKLKEVSASGYVDHFPTTEVEIQTEERKNLCQTAEIIIPKGNPEIDMTRQLASNEESIDRLTRQNERLSRTLKRLREHRRISNNRMIINNIEQN